MGSHRSCDHHVVIFPFMAEAHSIPLLYLARFLLRLNLHVTVFTVDNRQFLARHLRCVSGSLTIKCLSFLEKIAPVIPMTTAVADELPSMSLFYEFVNATVAMQPSFEGVLEDLLKHLPRVSFMITDVLLWWTQESAAKIGVPRLCYFSSMNCYSLSLTHEAFHSGILYGSQPHDELLPLTRFPWIRLSKEHFDPRFINPEPMSPGYMVNVKILSALANSDGILVNSFYELEPNFADFMSTQYSLQSWCIGGPFFLTDPMLARWALWLNQKLEEKCCVLYVAFGPQADIISKEQLEEIAIGLEESMVNFLWVIRKEEWVLPDGFEERVKGRGVVTRELVDQVEILMHESVKGFLSNCEWNSVMESIYGGVPILAWPMMAEQPLNAKMVEEEIKVGFRVEKTSNGFVKWEALRKSVKELMEEEKGREARKKVKELAEMAINAVQEGGSSWSTVESILHETCHKNKKKKKPKCFFWR